MAPTSCFNGQVHRLPDAPEAYGAMITRAKAAPGQSRYTDRALMASLDYRLDKICQRLQVMLPINPEAVHVLRPFQA